ncbi:hypothetical protein Tco_0339798 [Tanacetum coccineum]
MGMIVRGQLMLWGRENVEVTPDPVDNSGPIFDDEPMHSNDIYLTEQGDSNITIDLLDICYDRAQNDQDETDDLDQERDLLASLIQKLKYEMDDSKKRNKFLEYQIKMFQAVLDKYIDVYYASKVEIDVKKLKGI